MTDASTQKRPGVYVILHGANICLTLQISYLTTREAPWCLHTLQTSPQPSDNHVGFSLSSEEVFQLR